MQTTSKEMKYITMNLEKLRLKNNLSIETIANYLNITIDEYNQFLESKFSLSTTKLEDLCNLYGVDVSDIFDDIEPTTLTEINLSNLDAKDLKEIANLNRVVFNYIKMNNLKNKK